MNLSIVMRTMTCKTEGKHAKHERNGRGVHHGAMGTRRELPAEQSVSNLHTHSQIGWDAVSMTALHTHETA